MEKVVFAIIASRPFCMKQLMVDGNRFFSRNSWYLAPFIFFDNLDSASTMQRETTPCHDNSKL